MDIPFTSLCVIREKDGISIVRIFCGERAYIIRYFSYTPFHRGIHNDKGLSAYSVPTINVQAYTERASLMEDIAANPVYRLGCAEDLNDAAALRRENLPLPS